jgi:L-asparaginase II
MTPDEIMELANSCAGQHWMDEAHIQRFAALVVEAEREACATTCESHYDTAQAARAIRAREEK